MLNYHDGAAVFNELAEGGEQFADIVKVQAGGRLVEDIQNARQAPLRCGMSIRTDAVAVFPAHGFWLQMRGQLHSLGLTA